MSVVSLAPSAAAAGATERIKVCLWPLASRMDQVDPIADAAWPARPAGAVSCRRVIFVPSAVFRTLAKH